MKKVLIIIAFIFISFPVHGNADTETDARAIIQAAMDHWRGTSSYAEILMTIKRDDWTRKMHMRAWTKGEEESLVRVVEPKSDAGSGSLMKGKNLWTFSPKINRVIKIPSSMMNQGWMGSDFSNRDISRSTAVVNQYDHRLIKTYSENGYSYHVIESIPKEDAAVVWGKEVFTIRDDDVMVRQEYWDQEGVLVKLMEALAITEMGGRTLASRIRIGKVESPNEWTEMETIDIQFNIKIAKSTFSLSNLRNPRAR